MQFTLVTVSTAEDEFEWLTFQRMKVAERQLVAIECSTAVVCGWPEVAERQLVARVLYSRGLWLAGSSRASNSSLAECSTAMVCGWPEVLPLAVEINPVWSRQTHR